MRWRPLVWPAVALAAVALLAWRSGTGSREQRFYAPQDYVERADRFIDDGLLVADCSERTPRLRTHLEQASVADRAWYRDSYLAADVARFNRDPDGFGWAFAIDADCRLRGVNPVVHAVELPFYRPLRWLGSILWRGEGADATLRSAARTITLRRSVEAVGTDRSAATAVGSGETLLEENVVLLHFPGGPGQPAARIFDVGDEVVVHNRVRAERPESVRLLGHLLPVGRMARLETADWLFLSSEDPNTRAAETFVFLGGEAQAVASIVRRQNDRFERSSEDGGLGRIRDPVRDATYPFLDLVATRVGTALAVLPEDVARGLADGFDLQLTLDREVQYEVADAFARYSRALRRRDRTSAAFSAGITVMDGLRGDLLALGTYPAEDDVGGIGGARRGRLLRNQNFVLHPIGSAGKPFFFAAVADAFPELLALTIDEHAAERYHPDLFHCALPLGYQLLDGHYGEIDFVTALEVSCNKYTMELATLALAIDRGRTLASTETVPIDESIPWPRPGETSGVRLGGSPLRGAPDLRGFILPGRPLDDGGAEQGAAIRCASMDRLDTVAWAAPLGRITGAAVYRGEAPRDLPEDATLAELRTGYATNRYDLEPWHALLEPLLEHADRSADWKIRSAMQQIAPERVNLALNQVTRVRADYVSLLLGGGTSVWTNVQLAEATSRLVTGLAVRARLADRVLARSDADRDADNDGPESAAAGDAPGVDADRHLAAALPAPLGIDEQARGAVLEGMRRVVEGGRGTARDLRDELAAIRAAFPGDTVAIYAKTGSPITERTVSASTARALEQLVVRGRVALAGRGLEVRTRGGAHDHAYHGEDGRRSFHAALSTALGEVGASRSASTRSAILRVLDELAADLADPSLAPAEIEGPLVIDARGLRVDREDRFFRRRRVKGMAGVLVLSIVRLPGQRALPPTPADLAHPDARVLTLAIHLEADRDSEVAVAAAEAVLPEVVPLLR